MNRTIAMVEHEARRPGANAGVRPGFGSLRIARRRNARRSARRDDTSARRGYAPPAGRTRRLAMRMDKD